MALSAAALASRANLTKMQNNLLDNPELLTGKPAQRSTIGGSRMPSVLGYVYRAAKGRCVHCQAAVSLDVAPWRYSAATVGTLIPCSMTETDSPEPRNGITPGNIALFCRACVNRSNDANKNGIVWVWTPDIIDAWRVPQDEKFPPFPKVKKEQTESDHAHYRNSIRVSRARGCVI